jgi:hypothetical protein
MASIQKTKRQKKAGKTIREYNKGRVFTILYLLIIITSFFKIYPYIFDKKLNLNGDNANYYVLGAALSQGEGYTMISSPSNPPANHFPPGYPVIVATVMKFFSTEINTIKQTNGFFLLLSIIALFYLFYKIIDNIHISFISTLFILLNTNLLEYSTIMMSEISFLFFSIICLILVIQVDEKIVFYKNWKFLLLILFVAISYYIRSAGLALVGGIILVFLLQKNWKFLVAFVGGFVLLTLPWYIRGNKLGGNSYIKSLFWKNPYRTELGTADLGDWALRVYNNFIRYLTHEIPNATINSVAIKDGTPADLKHWLIGIALAGFIIFGLIKLKKYRFVIFSYFLGTFGIMLLWPDVWFGSRFILPIVPLLVFLIIMGIYNLLLLASRYLKIQNSFVKAVVFPLLFLAFLPLYTPGIHAMHKNADNIYPQSFQNYFDLAKWANKNTPENATFACRKTAFFYLYSSRKANGYAYTTNREEVIENLKINNIDYVVLDQLGYSSTGRYLYPAIKRYGNKFKLVKKTEKPETYLFEFKPNLGYWGEWKDDKRNGHGTYSWENGTRFEGQWKDDVRNGEGTFYLANGNQLIGTWKDEKMNGKFILKSKDGTIIEEAIYSNNRKVRTLNRK